MLQILICDDDSTFLANIKPIVENTLRDLSVTAKLHICTNMEQMGEDTLASCDIALLDIDFDQNQYNGLDIAHKLRKLRQDAVIIFITNYIEYAPQGYEVRAFRYLLKKDVGQKLTEYLSLAMEALAASGETLEINIYGEWISLRLREIRYIESQLRMVEVHMGKPTHKVYRYYATLSELEKKLEPHGFLRIHKSYLVNMRFIQQFHGKEVVLLDGTTLKVSQTDYAQKKKKYLFWKGYQ